MAFQRGRITFDQDLLEMSRKKIQVAVEVGMSLGSAVKSAGSTSTSTSSSSSSSSSSKRAPSPPREKSYAAAVKEDKVDRFQGNAEPGFSSFFK